VASTAIFGVLEFELTPNPEPFGHNHLRRRSLRLVDL
ncbi:uncharacterized protein METZ01_LOCUS443004, partial [marine metagenome]